ncbi:alginate lyase family protein [Halomonas sp. GXIMD04776]|uniref:alginate lyase family protein n=1 Tax=Halomonas sp. GXIMD04776 TaxID=3415605 RepID=UPI003CC55A3F
MMMALSLVFGSVFNVHAMTIEEREALDLSKYTVTDPDASYFDVQERIELIKNTDNPMLMQQAAQLRNSLSCQQVLAIPPLSDQIRIPGFYPSPDEWRFASRPLFQFEDTVSKLSGSYVASGDIYYAECLVSFLDHWAQADGIMDFYYVSSHPQAWFATESMIFAAAMAYSVVRPQVNGMQEEKERIDDWLNRLAHQHADIPGRPDNSCCNNHFYRRALYGTMVGILTEDQELFHFGVSAIYSALSDLINDGAFRLEMKRGRRASHYQNYALLYLVTNMQIVSRQGYDIFDLEIDGKTIHDAVDFALDIFENPAALGDLAPAEQYTGFFTDDQYFAWMEIYQHQFNDPRIAEFIKPMRPIFNRSAGGYATLYFMDPDAQRHEIIEQKREEIEETEVFSG